MALYRIAASIGSKAEGHSAGQKCAYISRTENYAKKADECAYTASGNLMIGDYMINGRRVVYRSVAELRAAIHAAERDVQAEQAAANIAAGLGGRQRFVVRM